MAVTKGGVNPMIPGVKPQATDFQIPRASTPYPSQYANPYTVQDKIISVNNQFGNTGIAYQQGTSRAIYDALPLDASSFNLRFFESVQTRQFPFTNINQNRLPPGETLAIQRMYFYVMISAAPPIVTSTLPLSGAVATAGLYQSIVSLNIAQNELIKKFPLSSMQAQFNKTAKFLGNDCIHFDNNIVLPPQLEFTVDINLPGYVAVANSFLVCVIEGLGSVLSPKQNF